MRGASMGSVDVKVKMREKATGHFFNEKEAARGPGASLILAHAPQPRTTIAAG